MKLKGSNTEGNLKDAFAGESQANRRYLYFAQKADVEGYNDVALVFRSTAEGETGHAHGHLEYLQEVGDPATGKPIGETKANLASAIAGETHEWQGRVVRTESELDPVSRMVHVVAEVSDPYAPSENSNQPPLAVGMYVEAEIEGRLVQNVAAIPRAALRGRDQVLVVSADEHLEFRDVAIFRSTTDAIYVQSGLSNGELVVVSPPVSYTHLTLPTSDLV